MRYQSSPAHVETVAMPRLLPPRVVWLLLGACVSLPRDAQAGFGQPVSYVRDDRFKEMGQATLKTFDIVGEDAVLGVELDNTIGEDEVWVLDFQPFETNDTGRPVTTNVTTGTAMLLAERTGECSSVFRTSTANRTHAGFYDDSWFPEFMNTTGNKKFFNNYTRGEVAAGQLIRLDSVVFSGPMATFFTCKNQDNTSIWERHNYTEQFEYNTTLYMTNVRPKVGPYGSSYVQSHAVLYWRLLRVAISKFLISSTRQIRPIFEYAIVKAHYDANGDPDWTKAHIEMAFKTVMDSDSYLMAAYRSNSLVYEPLNNNNSLHSVINEPSYNDSSPAYTMAAAVPVCDFDDVVAPGLCVQRWIFRLVLNVFEFGKNVRNGEPIDATGNFIFKFLYLRCPNMTDNNMATCSILTVADAEISAQITLQTVVEVTDDNNDNPRVEVKTVYGSDPSRDLQGGVPPGVSHMEEVTLETHFFPEFLRTRLKMELTLFLVCVGQQYSTSQYPDGCLRAPTSDRYSAYEHPDFRYEGQDEEGATVTYTADDIESPMQSLSYNGYVADREVHQTKFVNRALSGVSETYTVTSVFRLTALEGRKKRRVERDIMVKATVPQGLSHALRFAGCPENSTFVRETLDCVCLNYGEAYSSKTFRCEKGILSDVEVKEEGTNEIDTEVDGKESGSASLNNILNLVGSIGIVLLCLVLKD
ncbi:uncharacterized protein [Branchiostoma lanceolatum]|uniref:uncharacterized protein n=1 Tax=Branchiostoma lanceolatum TaxID=7740 RepID=UPI003456B9B5